MLAFWEKESVRYKIIVGDAVLGQVMNVNHLLCETQGQKVILRIKNCLDSKIYVEPFTEH